MKIFRFTKTLLLFFLFFLQILSKSLSLQSGKSSNDLYNTDMLQKHIGVVLHVVKYSDKANIAHIYTERSGRMSCLIPVPRSRKSGVRQVLFQPLSLIEFEIEVRPRSGLHLIKDAKAWYLFHSLPYDPYKSSIAMFLAEFLYRVLKEETENMPLFSYLTYSVLWLDMCEAEFANFHLVFLMRLSRFLGIYPNLEDYQEGYCFDLRNACFVESAPLHRAFVNLEESVRLLNLMRMNYKTMHLFRMNRVERNRCLELICEYYRLHLPEFPDLRSLAVLKELF